MAVNRRQFLGSASKLLVVSAASAAAVDWLLAGSTVALGIARWQHLWPFRKLPG